MREDEANFIAIPGLREGRQPTLLTRYSGYSLAYDYALSALVKADRDTAVAVSDGLSEEVKADRRARAKYLKQFEGPVAEASNAANNAYLKANQQQDGTRSYEPHGRPPPRREPEKRSPRKRQPTNIQGNRASSPRDAKTYFPARTRAREKAVFQGIDERVPGGLDDVLRDAHGSPGVRRRRRR